MHASFVLSTDVLVVGAGSAGCAVAANFALRGRDVLLIDKRDPTASGARWLNAVPPWCFDEAGLARPEAPEKWGSGEGASHLTVAGSTRTVRLPDPDPVHVDMRALVMRLRDRAIAAGVRCERGAVTEVRRAGRGGRVDRVEVEGLGEVRARLVVDASGMGGAIRRRVPALASRCPAVRPEDICAAAQFQHAVSDPDGLRAFLATYGAVPGDSVGILGVAGGYSTLTIFTEPTCREVGVLAGSIPALGAATGAQVLEGFVSRAPWIGERLYGGQSAIPLRRPYGVLGAAGVALVGDAACQVYSSHGSGVGMGLVAARMLADAVGDAEDPGTDEGLDRYTRSFHRVHGGLLTSSDAFRRLSQGIERGVVASLIEHGILDARALTMGLAQRQLEPERAWLFDRAAHAARAPRAALAVAPTLARMAALAALGGLAPPPRGMRGRAWDTVVEALVGRAPRGKRDIDHVEVSGRGPAPLHA